MTTPNNLLVRQLSASTSADGQVDSARFHALVVAAYSESDQDRRRVDRANRLMAEELAEALDALELQNIRFKAALDNMIQGLCLCDADGTLAVCNRRFLEIFCLLGHEPQAGVPLGEVVRHSLLAAAGPEGATLLAEYVALDRQGEACIEQAWPDGRIVAIVRKKLADGGFLDTVSDITESRAASARIAHMAQFDALTGLANRTTLREHLQRSTQDLRRDGPALLCLDLDRFKTINDTRGHQIGDALLVAVSRRLSSLVREGDLIARLGGDEFAILQHRCASIRDAEALARRIVAELGEPFRIGGHQLRVGASVGITLLHEPGLSLDEMLRQADLALYRAKNDGRGGYRAFEPELYQLAAKQRQLEADLRTALEENQLVVHYQPQIDLGTERVSGFEALVRWKHPVRGLVPPDEFIGIAEETGLIDQLCDYVLNIACRDAGCWSPETHVAVNLSAVQFQSGALVPCVERALTASGLTASRLELEITESVFLKDSASVLEQLRRLKTMGVRVSLDDFGTGYSSLSYIRSFPFDRVKIDRLFVKDLGSNSDSLAIVRAVTGLCSSLGIGTVAEGVETSHQLECLRRERCDNVQGFLFSTAVPLDETEALIRRIGQSWTPRSVA